MLAIQTGILGIETLLGREIKEVVEGRGSAGALVAYVLAEDEKPGEPESDAVALERLTPKSMTGLTSLLLAGSAKAASQAYDLAKAAGGRPILIDCQAQLESLPEAFIVAPLVSEPDVRDKWLFVVAHPVASALTLVLSRLARSHKVRTAVANIFEPASEQGKAGVSELHQQTTALLSFKTLKKEIFDAQVSFNLLPRVGEDAAAQLHTTEARIDRHLATLLSRLDHSVAIPMPSLRVVQAPVFHGYSISLWLEFEGDVQAPQIEEALASAQIEIRRQEEEPPDNVGAASQNGLIAGDIRIDRNNPRAAWVWIVMDNLRVVADAAADIIRTLHSPSQVPAPGGKRRS